MNSIHPPSSAVTFPVSEAGSKAVNVQPISHLRPFRRMSLPTAPTLIHRESVVSVASFDSLPEEGEAPVSSGIRPGSHGHGHGHLAPKRLGPGKGRIESPRRRTRRDASRPADDPRNAKRKKVIEEFYQTEKAYVDGLDLIYSVRYLDCCPSFVLTPGYVGSTSSPQSLHH